MQDDPSNYVEAPLADVSQSVDSSKGTPNPASSALMPAAAAAAMSAGKVHKQPKGASAGRVWRPLTKGEVENKRQHQSAISQSVVLLIACLGHTIQKTSLHEADIKEGSVTGGAGPVNAEAGPVNAPAGQCNAEAGTIDFKAGPVKAEHTATNTNVCSEFLYEVGAEVDGGKAGKLLLPVLEALSNPQELKLHVMTACQMVDRGVGSRIAIAANHGTHT